ncbi:MAG: protein kinase [Gemmatimonadota bacterium]|nr:protein kinase [Gemmatimonadota bacterium]
MRIPSLDEVQRAVRDHYVVEDLLGHGGMGAVYKARHVSLEAPVAIKVLPVPASVGADELARFRREAMLAAQLRHPNIVPVHEFDIHDDLAYLIMPFVEGASLADRLAADGPLTLPETTELLEQVGSGLAFAHERGVVHRDVKPGNILWEPATARWMITDFGIARHVQPDQTALTASGMVIGTPAYMAPEQAAAAHVDERSDLYALAAVAFEALTGNRPEPMADRPKAVAGLQAHPPGLPSRQAAILAAPLALAPDERPASVREWLRLLKTAHSRRTTGRVVFGLTGTALAIAAGVTVLRMLTPTPPAGPPIVALLPTIADDELATSGLPRDVAFTFEEQLRYVSGMQVLPAAATAASLASRFGPRILDPDSAAAHLAREAGVAEVLVSRLRTAEPGRVELSVERRASDGRRLVGPAVRTGSRDSLSAMVVALMGDLFAQSLARERVGYAITTPSGGAAAWQAYFTGDSLLRAGAYARAIEEFRRVIALDSTYAPAYFKRMLAEVMQAQPTRASAAVRSALSATRRYRDRLDSTTQRVLEGYEMLVARGDVQGAHDHVSEIVIAAPLSADAWFILGYLEWYFGPLYQVRPVQARPKLRRASELMPGFAALHGLLGWIAISENEDQVARAQLRTYLSIDSTSAWAQLVRMVDSLRFRGPPLTILASIPERDAATLEFIALAGSALTLRPVERDIVQLAARTLRDRATTDDQRRHAFRLQMGTAMGLGRLATADSLWREARRWSVPADETASWLLLLHVTGLHDALGTARERDDAAALLAADTTDPTAAWLTARWYRGRDAGAERRSRRHLQRLGRAADGPALLARSLEQDLQALEHLARGDTLAAFAAWRGATARYQIEQVPFGLVASLWPLRLAWARAAVAHGDVDLVLVATFPFEYATGFMDQVPRLVTLPLRADAVERTEGVLAARDLRQRALAALEQANGAGVAARTALAATVGTR